jgi:hypothetical protein
MNCPLDPWLHAEALAHRLSRSRSRLIIVIGAEAWCQKCREFRPVFNARASQAAQNETWLWLDMEEHAEFIAPYLPPDLPLLVCYEQKNLINLQVLDISESGLEKALSYPVIDPTSQDPGIRSRLSQENWAF